MRYAGLERSAAVEAVSKWGKGGGGGTDPKVVPWSPILIMSATLSFMRIAPMGTPCKDRGKRSGETRLKGPTLARGFAMVRISGWQQAGMSL